MFCISTFQRTVAKIIKFQQWLLELGIILYSDKSLERTHKGG